MHEFFKFYFVKVVITINYCIFEIMKFSRIIENNRIVRIGICPWNTDLVVDLRPVEGDFSKSRMAEMQLDDVYISASLTDLNWEGGDSDSGMAYLYSFSFGFPVNGNEVLMLQRFRMLKYICAYRCDGKSMLLGRNDYGQNAPLIASVSSDGQRTQLSYSLETIFPVAFQ